MVKDRDPSYAANLRAINSAIASVTLGIIAVPFLLEKEEMGLFFMIASMITLGYSYIAPLFHS